MRIPFLLQLVLVATASFASVWVVANPQTRGMIGSLVSSASANSAGIGGACDIKGNVSINSGERIYHVPGQHYYLQTKIRPEYGERWFCSEAEARAAGWRKSGV